MATDHGHGNGANSNPDVEFDKSDLSARSILIFFFVLAVFAVVIHLIVLGLYAGMTRIANQHEAQVSPLAPQTFTPRQEILMNTNDVDIQQFPQPRLLHHVGGVGEMTKMLRRETAVLTAPPWRDAQGNVHLPIDQAMKAVLPQLPVRPGGEEVPNYPGASRVYSYPAPDSAAERIGPIRPIPVASGDLSASKEAEQQSQPLREDGR